MRPVACIAHTVCTSYVLDYRYSVSANTDYISNILEQAWLTRYPWPQEVILHHKRGNYLGRNIIGVTFPEIFRMNRKIWGLKVDPAVAL